MDLGIGLLQLGRLPNGMFNPGAVLDMNYSKAGTFRTYANLGLEYKNS